MMIMELKIRIPIILVVFVSVLITAKAQQVASVSTHCLLITDLVDREICLATEAIAAAEARLKQPGQTIESQQRDHVLIRNQRKKIERLSQSSAADRKAANEFYRQNHQTTR